MAQKEEEAVVTCLHNVVCSPFLPTSNVSLRCCLCPPLRPSSHGIFLLMKTIQSLRLRPLLYPGAKETQSCLVDISSVVSSTLVRFVFETVFLPNGLCTLFGHVSAWCANAGIAAMSNLSVFLVLIQRGQFSPQLAWRSSPPPLAIVWEDNFSPQLVWRASSLPLTNVPSTWDISGFRAIIAHLQPVCS